METGRRGVELGFSTAKSLGFWGSVASVAGSFLCFIPESMKPA